MPHYLYNPHQTLIPDTRWKDIDGFESIEDKEWIKNVVPLLTPSLREWYTEKITKNIMDDELEKKLKMTIGDIKMKMTDEQLHKKILDEIHETYKAKNKDYGNSFSKQYEEFGLLSSIIRITDKYERLKQLYKNNEANVKDESIEDTLLDMANYAIMTVMEMKKEKEGK